MSSILPVMTHSTAFRNELLPVGLQLVFAASQRGLQYTNRVDFGRMPNHLFNPASVSASGGKSLAFKSATILSVFFCAYSIAALLIEPFLGDYLLGLESWQSWHIGSFRWLISSIRFLKNDVGSLVTLIQCKCLLSCTWPICSLLF